MALMLLMLGWVPAKTSALHRFEFIECLIRIALALKEVKSVEGLVAGFDAFVEHHLRFLPADVRGTCKPRRGYPC